MGSEEAKSADWNDTFSATVIKFYGDNTTGTYGGTVETELASLSIPQDDLGSAGEIQVWAPIRIFASPSSAQSGTFNLKVGGSTVKTIQLATGAGDDDTGTYLNYFGTGIDTSSGTVTVQVTGKVDSATANKDVVCYGIQVIGKRYSS